MNAREFVLDGANLLYREGSPCADTLERVCRALATRYGLGPRQIIIVMDANHQHYRPTGVDRLASWHVAPSVQGADEFILDYAAQREAIVVSNDLYRKHTLREGVLLLQPAVINGVVALPTTLLRLGRTGEQHVPAADLGAVSPPGAKPAPPSAPAVVRGDPAVARVLVEEVARLVASAPDGLSLGALGTRCRAELAGFDERLAEGAAGSRDGRFRRLLARAPERFTLSPTPGGYHVRLAAPALVDILVACLQEAGGEQTVAELVKACRDRAPDFPERLLEEVGGKREGRILRFLRMHADRVELTNPRPGEWIAALTR